MRTRERGFSLIEVALDGTTHLLAEEVVRWADDRRVRGVLRHVDDERATIAVVEGMKALGESGLGVGDPVFFRHAKAGELAEHFARYALVRGDRLEGHAATYRGDGYCFL